MSKVIVVGGVLNERYQKGHPWTLYKSANVIELDLKTGAVEERYVLSEPPGYMKDRGALSPFKAASLDGEVMLLCTTTHIYEVSISDWACRREVTHRKMNDVHHVVNTGNNTLLVVSTGLDAILELDWNGNLVESWPLTQRASIMLSDEIDYRNVECTKPHDMHPNYIFNFCGEWLVTRFNQADAIGFMSASDTKISIPDDVNIHDGLVSSGKIWFTSTNGNLYCYDGDIHASPRIIEVSKIYDDDRPKGWCRGVEILKDGRVLVGFSRLRETKFKDNLRKVAGRFVQSKGEVHPARVVCVNAACGSIDKEYDLTGYMDAIFSIHSLD